MMTMRRMMKFKPGRCSPSPTRLDGRTSSETR
jgi:hypothetical protein